MTIAGLTMIARSSDSKQTAISQKQNSQALAVAETGVTRTLSALNNPANVQYITLNLSDWSSAGTNNSFDPCNALGLAPMTADELTDSKIDPNDSSKGEYTVIDYSYNSTTEEGELTVKGEIGAAQANVQVVVPKTNGQISLDLEDFPGLYADDTINLGNNDVLDAVSGTDPSNANVICAECEIPDGAGNICTSDGQFDLSDADAQTALGALDNATIDGKLLLGKLDLDPVPTITDSNDDGIDDITGITYNTISSGGNSGNSNGNSNGNNNGNGNDQALNPQLNGDGILIAGLSIENLIAQNSSQTTSSVINSSLTLPQSGDVPEIDDNGTPGDTSDDIEIYHYKVDSISLTGNKTLTIETSDNQAVYLYVSGNIDIAGTVTVAHNKVDNSGT